MQQLTLTEKVALISGTEFWKTNPIPRLNLKSLYLTDGPNGLRKQGEETDHLGLNESIPATCFPTGSALGSSWDPELLKKIGVALAQEARMAGVDLLLGPAINIKRNPKCGRNFEYFTEDPFLAGVLGTEYVKGVQSQGVGAVVKHFAANNNENYRFMGNSVIDLRALNEIYLRAFKMVVKNAHPRGIMSAYNRLNGEFCSENQYLLKQLLRNKWSFKGIVVSDWGGIDDRVRSLAAGCDLEMPGDCDYFRAQVTKSIKNGQLSKKVLDKSVKRILETIFWSENQLTLTDNQKNLVDKHLKLAIEAAVDGAVLLKNADKVLPLQKNAHLIVVGDLFQQMRYQGAGSSLVNPTELVTPAHAFAERQIDFDYLQGYRQFDQTPDDYLEQQTLEKCQSGATVLFFGGQTDLTESEGYDRDTLKLPSNQQSLLRKLIKNGCQVILVLFGGSAVVIPELDKIKAVLNMNLPGQGGGEATAQLLFGEVNPSGKLAETWLNSYDTVPFGAEYTTGENELYTESVFVGYRYYDNLSANKIEFPFGFGLSYTSFDYHNFHFTQDSKKITATFELSNEGEMAGAEIAQLYVGGPNSQVFKPVKELRAFKKIFLKKGQSQLVEMSVKLQDLAYFNPQTSTWIVENGKYHFYLASSSRTIEATKTLKIENQTNFPSPYQKERLPHYFDAVNLMDVNSTEFGQLFTGPIPLMKNETKITLNTRLDQIQHSFLGKMFYKAVINVGKKEYQQALKKPQGKDRETSLKNGMFLVKMLPNNSLRSMSVSSAGQFKLHLAQGLVLMMNHHYLAGLRKIVFAPRVASLPKKQNPGGI
ncbi:beta-glucosidase [Liquorilactobacillus nagelii DSM 13675]|nr:beta-glucosidase [Liquorilactobacillus nagelii DSM 13675]